MKKLTALILVVMLLACSVSPVLAAAEPTVNIVSASLSLEDNVYIWFDMTLSGAEFASSDYGMIFWTAEQTEYTYEKAEASSEAVIRTKDEGSISHDDKLACDVASFKYGVAAKQMTDVIRAQAYVKTSSGYAYSAVKAYSVQEYAADKLGLTPGVTGTADEKLKTLLRDMLDYGASAQLYFGYKTGDLANALPTIVVSSANVAAGRTVDVTIALKNNPGISSMKLIVAFDDTVLKLDSVTYNGGIGGMSQQPQTQNNPTILNWYNGGANSNGDFVYATLTFTVSRTTAEGIPVTGNYDITVTYDADNVYNIDNNNVSFDIINGQITVF